MPITVACPSCKSALQVRDEFAGRRGKCPKCHQPLEVPRAPAASSADPPANRAADTVRPAAAAAAPRLPRATPVQPSARPAEQRRAALLADLQAALDRPIEPIESPFTYRLAMALVAVVMLLIPLIYVALIGVTVWGVVYHLQHNTGVLGSLGRGRGALGALLLYLAPVGAGGILVFFMIKPFFARRENTDRGRSITRQGEPLLFAFVDRICEVVGAPKPVRIDIDGQVNASASFRRGLWSMFRHDLVLTIGMPLVAGLNVRDFGGVLAHEFGHFSQGAGMRLSYLIRRTSHWLTRVVYERDAWDDWLRTSAGNLDLRIGWVLYLAMFCVWLTRKILWLFMMLGHTVSSYLLRQMEFDADRHAVRVTGSQSFVSTEQQLALLNVASDRAFSDLADYYREGRLTDDLPQQIVAAIPLLPATVQQAIEKQLAETATGWFDTHPASRDRVAAARHENAAGMLHNTCPARDLFVDFAASSRGVTMDLYRAAFGNQLNPDALHPLSDLLTRQAQQQRSQEALGRYAQGTFTVLRPILIPSAWLDKPQAPQANLALIRRARSTLLDARLSYEQSALDFDLADSRRVEVEQAGTLLNAEFKLKASHFSLPLTSRAEVRAARDRITADRLRAAGEMQAIQTLLGRRLMATFELLSVKQVADRVPTADEMQAEARDLLALAYVLNRQQPDTLSLRDVAASLSAAVGQLQPQESRQPLIDTIFKLMKHASEMLSELRARLDRERYPFDHAQAGITVAAYVLSDLPSPDDPGAILNACSRVLDGLSSLESRVFGQLAWLAEQVETALGLEPLPEPVAKS